MSNYHRSTSPSGFDTLMLFIAVGGAVAVVVLIATGVFPING